MTASSIQIDLPLEDDPAGDREMIRRLFQTWEPLRATEPRKGGSVGGGRCAEFG